MATRLERAMRALMQRIGDRGSDELILDQDGRFHLGGHIARALEETSERYSVDIVELEWSVAGGGNG